jgi:hypothetical protein
MLKYYTNAEYAVVKRAHFRCDDELGRVYETEDCERHPRAQYDLFYKSLNSPRLATENEVHAMTKASLNHLFMSCDTTTVISACRGYTVHI